LLVILESKITLLDSFNENHPLRHEITECFIDVTSSCNLACPTCPVGNMGFVQGPNMEISKFKKIISKLKNDFPYLEKVSLYNWTEPILYSKLPEFIEIVQDAGFDCNLSANLNMIKNLEEIIKKDPAHIRVSVSGFTQEVYVRGHTNGDIEVVKKNMKTLSDLIKKYNASTKVTVFYLKYKYNLSEIQMMKDYASELGFYFDQYSAIMQPIEKVFDYIENPEKLDVMSEEIIKKLRFDPKLILDECQPYKKNSCTLLENQLIIDSSGNIQLCCVTSTPENVLGSYLDMTPEEIYQKRHCSNTCKKCMGKGLHIYYASKFDDEDFNLIWPKMALNKKQQRVIEMEKNIHQLNLIIQEKDKLLEERHSMILEKNKQLEEIQKELHKAGLTTKEKDKLLEERHSMILEKNKQLEEIQKELHKTILTTQEKLR